MATLRKRIYQEIDQLSDQQLQNVLIFIEFLNTREDSNFIDYVNKRTQIALNNREKVTKFHTLEELQQEFSRS